MNQGYLISLHAVEPRCTKDMSLRVSEKSMSTYVCDFSIFTTVLTVQFIYVYMVGGRGKRDDAQYSYALLKMSNGTGIYEGQRDTRLDQVTSSKQEIWFRFFLRCIRRGWLYMP